MCPYRCGKLLMFFLLIILLEDSTMSYKILHFL